MSRLLLYTLYPKQKNPRTCRYCTKICFSDIRVFHDVFHIECFKKEFIYYMNDFDARLISQKQIDVINYFKIDIWSKELRLISLQHLCNRETIRNSFAKLATIVYKDLGNISDLIFMQDVDIKFFLSSTSIINRMLLGTFFRAYLHGGRSRLEFLTLENQKSAKQILDRVSSIIDYIEKLNSKF